MQRREQQRAQQRREARDVIQPRAAVAADEGSQIVERQLLKDEDDDQIPNSMYDRENARSRHGQGVPEEGKQPEDGGGK